MKKTPIIILTLLLFFLTSCLEIIEEVQTKKDGSGTAKVTLNLSQSKAKVESLMNLDEVQGVKVPSKAEARARLEELKSKLATQKGISEVVLKQDYANFIFELSCRFTDIPSLDAAVKNTAEAYNKNGAELPAKNISAGQNYLERHSATLDPAKNKIPADLRSSFEKASYTCVYRFDNEVSKASNPVCKTSQDKKAVFWRVNILEALAGKSSVANKITYKQ